jgi:FtsP/CotA-like multicopper oxidase with cupredoxin domain
VATQVMLGLYGSLIVEPRHGGAHYDRDYTYVLSEWDNELTPDVASGKAPRGPRDATLRGGELGTDEFLINGRIHEAIPPIVVTEGDTVLLRLINAGTLAHPFHTHGHSFKIVATDGNPVPEGAQLTKDTVLIAPGERYDLVFEANNPGVWMVHCHIENHAANGMMSLIQYEGYRPTGPIADLWDRTPTDAGQAASPVSAEEGHDGHGGPGATSPTATDAAQTGGDNARIAMVDDRFEPNSLTVTVGTTVIWVNTGADWHSVAAFDGSFESAQLASGETFSYTFTAPGTYRFICKHHGRQGMIGQVVVTP